MASKISTWQQQSSAQLSSIMLGKIFEIRRTKGHRDFSDICFSVLRTKGNISYFLYAVFRRFYRNIMDESFESRTLLVIYIPGTHILSRNGRDLTKFRNMRLTPYFDDVTTFLEQFSTTAILQFYTTRDIFWCMTGHVPTCWEDSNCSSRKC